MLAGLVAGAISMQKIVLAVNAEWKVSRVHLLVY